jgi:hypothetical protein
MSSERNSGSHPKRQRIGERTMLACTGCKQKKLKVSIIATGRYVMFAQALQCDGQTPKCLNCVRSNRDCLVEDPATGLHRPRDYLRSLEARVAYLESLLQQSRPEVALDHLSAAGVPQSAVEQVSPGWEACDENIDDLSSDVALLCLSAAGREPHYFGPS